MFLAKINGAFLPDLEHFQFDFFYNSLLFALSYFADFYDFVIFAVAGTASFGASLIVIFVRFSGSFLAFSTASANRAVICVWSDGSCEAIRAKISANASPGSSAA